MLQALFTAVALLAAPATRPADVVTVTLARPATPRAISPYVYGTNQIIGDPSRFTLVRLGGNRLSAYNWENNASNAGADWHHQSDGFLGGGDRPGGVAREFLTPVLERGQAAVLTVPTGNYVAADKGPEGDVNQTPDYLEKRFHKNVAATDGTIGDSPDLSDNFVYQDQSVKWVETHFPPATRGGPIWYALDNEPDLWQHTHPRIFPDPLTYADFANRSERFAKAVKSQAPDALMFGFVSYGFNGFRTLQDAPDADGRDATDFFLDQMAEAETRAGRRLVDVLDLHWYPETQGGGMRIVEQDASPAVAAARVQAPRHLYDPAFREQSWIDQVLGEPLRLLPRYEAKIAGHYPGTKLAITEYNYGGGDDISGGLAQADALGAFGRYGVFAAAFWKLSGEDTFTSAAFDLYRNYDGRQGSFGEESLDATSGDLSRVGVWAASRKADGAVTLLLINRSESPARVRMDDAGGLLKPGARLFRLAGDAPRVVAVNDKVEAGRLDLPPRSATLVESK